MTRENHSAGNDDDKGVAKRRGNSSYGKGFIDGVNSAMNKARLAELERAQTGIARKVLELVPNNEPWTMHQMQLEAVRVNGPHLDRRTLEGCLNHLCGVGLVKRANDGWIRVLAKEYVPPAQSQPEPAVAEVRNEEKPADQERGGVAPTADIMELPVDPMTKLAKIAQHARATAELLNRMASEIDDVAIAAEESMQKALADTEKLRQLQSLLKDIQIGG